MTEEAAIQCGCPEGERDPDEPGCMYFDFGYPWCRSCAEHHRPPECPVDEQGYSLTFDGERWEDFDRHLAETNRRVMAAWARRGQ